MALVVDKTVKYLNVPDANNFTFKCSKPMSQLTVDDVKSADSWVGFTSFAHNQMSEGNVESGIPQNDPNHCWCWATDPSALYNGDWSTAHWSFPANYPTGIYMRNILVECAAAHAQDTSLQNDASARIVMDIEAGEATKIQDLYISGSSYIVCPYNNENRVTDYRYIKPAVLMIVNGVLYVWIQGFAPNMAGFYCTSSTSQGYRSSQSYDDYAKYPNHYLAMGWTRALETGNMYDDSGTTTSVNFSYTISDVDFNGVTADLNVTLGSANYNKRASLSITDNEDKEIEKWYKAFTGFKFKVDDVWYKPIVEGGIVTGYTDDMTVTSEWDTWDNITGHNVPVTPPVPPVPEDDPSDDQAWGGAYSGAGAFSKFYLCTATDLANLRTWFGGGGSGDPIPDGFDPMGQVLGLLQYPLSISGTALAPEEIVFRSGKTIVHTNVNATRSTGGFLHIDCGSVDIPRRMQERGVPFLDFETTLEVYVPFCGTAPLDIQTCVGKTLTCDIYVATATGDVSAVIAAGGHPVAYMSGNMAESLPISSAGYGMYLAACKSTWGNGVSQIMNQITGGTTSTIKNVNQAALNETLTQSQTGFGHSELIAESYNNPAIGRGMAGAASAKGAAVIGLTTAALNVANAASTGYEQYQRVKNASYTSVSGSFTSCAAWNYPFTPYVKITRPHKQIPTGGHGDYKHTAAIPLVETRTLSGAPGLTTCVNPDVSGIANATAQEKDIIYRALVNGVIV